MDAAPGHPDHLPAPQRITDRVADSLGRSQGYRRPPDGAPNVLVIVLDDVGFSQLG